MWDHLGRVEFEDHYWVVYIRNEIRTHLHRSLQIPACQTDRYATSHSPGKIKWVQLSKGMLASDRILSFSLSWCASWPTGANEVSQLRILFKRSALGSDFRTIALGSWNTLKTKHCISVLREYHVLLWPVEPCVGTLEAAEEAGIQHLLLPRVTPIRQGPKGQPLIPHHEISILRAEICYGRAISSFEDHISFAMPIEPGVTSRDAAIVTLESA